ncbi:MAG: metalloregulator ArsR/SmtB family transcription factor [Candidatus Promineifilaceae bacterium]|nr:metalloregulator ArsR/SmtB family transcription factor [Candidatus Promineifilaceae bacterium]
METASLTEMDLVPLWKALADTKRRRIIHLLGEKPRTTSEISAYFDVSRFAVMRHLKVLEQVGLIKTRREGRLRWNFLNDELFRRIQSAYLDKQEDGEYRPGEILNLLARHERRRGTVGPPPEQQPLRLNLTLNASPEILYRALTYEIDSWWSYRIMVDSKVYLEADIGGRFYEVFRAGGGALYALVTYLKPGEEIRFSGSMGLIEEAASHHIQITIQPQLQHVGSSLLQLTHRFPERVNIITVDTFQRSWEELLNQHLKSFVEQGKRYQASI